MTGPCIALVVAVARNGVIGRRGHLPWHISSDLKHFKTITLGKPLIMGRKTWESLPRRPLPGRMNIVITRDREYQADGAIIAHDLAGAIEAAAKTGIDEICVIGGGEIFQEFLPRASRIYLSEVDLAPVGDIFFPAIDPLGWREVSRESFEAGPRDEAGFTLRVLDRISPVNHG